VSAGKIGSQDVNFNLRTRAGQGAEFSHITTFQHEHPASACLSSLGSPSPASNRRLYGRAPTGHSDDSWRNFNLLLARAHALPPHQSRSPSQWERAPCEQKHRLDFRLIIFLDENKRHSYAVNRNEGNGLSSYWKFCVPEVVVAIRLRISKKKISFTAFSVTSSGVVMAFHTVSARWYHRRKIICL
jgi:hypothetical protein